MLNLPKSTVKALNPIELLSFSSIKSVPLITQSEMAECGLACLAMICSYYGFKVDIASLRKHSLSTTQGMSLKDMMDIGSELQLSSRAVKCELEDLRHLSTPCILHWNLDHFVVLTKVTRNAVIVNDPAVGKRKLSLEDVSNSFTGVALELTPSTSFKKKDIQVTLKISQLWERIEGFKRALVSLVFLSVVMQFAALLSPYYMQLVIDSVLLSNDQPLLLVLAIGFMLLLFVQVFVSTLRSWFILKFNSMMSIQMGANLFHHLLRLPIGYFESRHIGDIVSRFGSIVSIRNMLTTGLVESLIDGLMAMVVLVMMFLYNAKLAAIVIAVVTASYAVQLAFYYPNRRLTGELILVSAKEDSNFLETLRAMQTIKLFSNETNRQNMWLNRFAEVINAEIKLGRLHIAESHVNKLLFGVENILVVYFGALAVMDAQLTVGMLIAFIAYKTQFTTSMTNFIDKVFSFKLLELHLERLSDIVFEKREIVPAAAVLPKQLSGHIRFDNVSFRYADNLDWVLKEVSFEVMPGECVALVGPSGSGKTTIMKLLLGILIADEGSIYVDGVKINDVALHDYRSRFGSVMQDDVLFSGTICENITMFESDYDFKRLEQSCLEANILDEIIRLPMGFHSLVGDMGNSFSGGQLQRLFLARALYKQPQVMCLDEATSHLDTDNENQINLNIRKMNMTRLIIAHRKETIASADRVIRL
ncbi:peptidase domain-containing ABC transporter [Vibrio splendidus]|uniref:peptidase domain-containing ABC transporter n=2 Tax=Vibrio splendidus TaxID=29497 RepID=UPI000C81ECCC|nr:peptidase domain-containing ABC transporter [Vibrio splendidus]PMI75369.1 ABC transporter ATP-binding protein [Vibrio splendidus]PMK58042.1 ABC transporter ATP-binding protein [Vibrio splendidus]